MNYENYPIQLSEYNLIPLSEPARVLLEDINRAYLSETFCADPSEYEDLELLIMYNTIEEYAQTEKTALCSYDPILLKYADQLDPHETISRQRLNVLLLDHCADDFLRVVFVDVCLGMWRYLVAQSVFDLSGLIAASLVSVGIDPELAEERAKEIADAIAMTPHKIQAVVLESVEIETINESIFDFPPEDGHCFDKDTDDDVPTTKIHQHLRAEKEPLEKQIYVEVHDGDTVAKYDADMFRYLVKDILTKPEQDSFVRIAAEIIAGDPDMFRPDQ